MVFYLSVINICNLCILLSRQILVPRTSRGRHPPTSQGRPERSYLTVPGTSQRCPNLTSWRRAEMTPGDVLIWRSWEIDSGCPQDDLVTSPRGPLEYSNLHAQFFLIFLFRTYLIDQVYLKAFQHSRCIKNPVKLLIWSISCKISELLFSR